MQDRPQRIGINLLALFFDRLLDGGDGVFSGSALMDSK
jgi:hypothetical protein